MELETGSGEPIKVEVVNFDSIRDNTLKVVVAAVATTIVSMIVEESMKSYFAKRRNRKMREEISKKPNN